VGEDFQAKLAPLAPSGATANEAFEPSLEHRHHGFDLNSIPVGSNVEARLHQPAITSAGWLRGRSAMFGGNDGAHATRLPREGMVGLRIKARIGGDAFDPDARKSSDEEWPEVRHVRLRSTAYVG
jgi:hypothetical protein